jgi:SPP1 gp7 family putative phage head morphogenesis protein
MRFPEWSPKRIIEDQYTRALRALVNNFASTYLSQDLPFDDPYDIIGKLQEYAGLDAFKEYAYAAASRMVTGLVVEGARTWREAARESMNGQMIYNYLQQELQGPIGFTVQSIIEENTRLISSFPDDLAAVVNNYIQKESFKGRRAGDIAADLKAKFKQVSTSRIDLIARTETSKASTALTRARAEDLGLDWYVWRTSKDARVRPSHRRMDRVLISWAEPASPELLEGIKSTLGFYNAGDCPNCRCYPEPILRISQVKWPAKVYHGGSIDVMNRFEFERLTGAGGLQIAA